MKIGTINRDWSIFVSVLLMLWLGTAHGATWTKTYGGTNGDHQGLTRQTMDGGFILAGHSASFGPGGYDLWVLKLNADGSIAWQRRYGGPEQESINSVNQTLDGGYIVAGATMSFAQGQNAGWLLKLDPSGNVQWQKSYGGNVGDGITSIQETPDGEYIAAGLTSSSGAGKYDAWVLKLKANGDILWQKTYGGTDDDWIYQIQQTTDGSYIAAGMTKSFGEGDQDVWLLKLKSNGDMEWEKTFGGTGKDTAISVQQTSDHGYIVAGYTESFGAGKQDAWVLKIAPDGTPQWQKAFGGPEDDAVYSIELTSDGGYIAAGPTFSFGAGSCDQWLLKLGAGGKIEWQKTYGGSKSEYAWSAEQTLDGGYLVSGNTDSFGVWGNDLWISKLDSNGNLSGCPMQGTSNAVVTDTTVTEKSSAAIVKSTNISPQVTDAAAVETTGTAIAPCQPAIAVNPDSVDFGSILVGNESLKYLVIMNAGSENVVLGTLTIGGNDASQFSLYADCSGQTLVPAAFCNAQIIFHPTSEGLKNASLSIPSSAASQGALTAPLRGTGVTSSAITLTVPPDQTALDACSFYQPRTFAWDETEYFGKYEIQFSLAENFKTIGVKYKATTPWAAAPSNTWKKVLRLSKDQDVETPIFWRVVGIRSDKAQVFSNVFSMRMKPCRPAGVPTITPTSRNAFPTMSWKHYCSIKYKATFWNNETGRKMSLSYSVKDPTEIGDLFMKQLTSNQWKSIRKLVRDESGKTIFWSVESWDGLKRYSKTDAISFELTD